MTRRPQMLNANQNNFLKTFERVTRRSPDWKVWSDWTSLAACSISNAVDHGAHWQQREDRYKEIIKPYTPDEVDALCKLFAQTVQALEDNPEQDFLGEMFMALDLGSHWHGQFFTPYHVCQFMASVANMEDDKNEIERCGYISVNDPTCGAGALLIASANDYRKRGINYQQNVLFVAQDIDLTAAMMCYIQLSLLGCPGFVVVGDTLAHPAGTPLPEGYEIWYTPMYFSRVWVWRRAVREMDKIADEAKKRAEKPKTPVREEPDRLIFEKAASGSSGFWFFFSENTVLQSTAAKARV